MRIILIPELLLTGTCFGMCQFFLFNYNLWLFAHLIVPLTPSKVLSLNKTKKNKFSFGFVLAYPYLCTLFIKEV